MSPLRPVKGPTFLSGSLIIGVLQVMAGCDSQPPAFLERSNPYGQSSDVYEGGVGDAGEQPDEPRDDETPEDRGESSGGPLAAAARWTFQSTTLAAGRINLDIASGRMEQRFVLDSNQVDTQLDFTQVNRPVTTETFLQGSEQEFRSENFQQSASASGLLDVLVVVDNSGSMSEEQNNLSNKLMPLLSYVSNSDWRVGVVTTDPNNGCLRGLVKKSDANATQLFSQAVTAGIQGSGVERGILQAVNGLKGQCNASGSWLRSHSTLAVLIVSDEDNCSDGLGCDNDPWASSNYLVDYMASIRQIGVNARVYGLVWHPSQAQSSCKTAVNKATTYADAISRTGGRAGSICDSDYSSTLQAISLDISQILRKQFALQYLPFPGSVKVIVNNVQRTQGFQIKGNVVEFAEAPASGSSIRIDYEFSNQPPKRDFKLAQAADASTLQVYIDGAETKAFTYESSTRTVRFTDAPLAYEIRTIYRQSGGLKTDFAIGKGAKTGTVKVKVDGQNLNSPAFTYFSNTGIVRLASAPKDQAKIHIQFTQEQEPKLRYPIYAAAGARSQIRVFDASSYQELAVTIDGDEIVFPPNVYRPLRPVVARYPIQGQDAWKVQLGSNILVDSIRVSGSQSGACETFSLIETTVDLKTCRFAASEAVSIAYTYAREHRSAFDLGSLDFDPKDYRWKVSVDGQEAFNYILEKNWLSFADLPLNSQVEVQVFRK
jgi:hypothetical protein